MKIKRIVYEEKIVCGQPNNILTGKVVLVIGAGSGIGQSIAINAEKAGAKVILAGRTKDSLEETQKLTNKAELVLCDVSKSESIYEMFKFCESNNGHFPDVIVNCAGYRSQIDVKRDFLHVSKDEWDTALSVNYIGNVMLADTYHQFLNRRHNKGTLIVVSSIDGMKAASTPYGISKSFLNAYIKSVAKFYDGVLQIYGIAPGPTTTRMMNEDMKFTYYRQDHPLMRCAVPQDIANLAVFMMSSYANIKEGTVIVCDGGMLL